VTGRRKSPDDAVSDALDHFQNRSYALRKAVDAVLTGYDRLIDDDVLEPLTTAIAELRKVAKP